MAATASLASAFQPCASGRSAPARSAALRAPSPRAAKARERLPSLVSSVASAGTTRASSVRDKRVGHRPPRETRLARRVEHDGDQRVRAP